MIDNKQGVALWTRKQIRRWVKNTQSGRSLLSSKITEAGSDKVFNATRCLTQQALYVEASNGSVADYCTKLLRDYVVDAWVNVYWLVARHSFWKVDS